ncbi:helix-turn-helix domain-containing protein [Phreatobacter sp.]|uniref:helix-turn-helix domain-containing protein n=1 Tax=Phreatobacter sp. TaxID=1966341 RepID=UPI003F702427
MNKFEAASPRNDEQETLRRIGERIRVARHGLKMTLDGLGKAAGLSTTFLSRLERGQVACSIGNLLQIAAALDLAPAALFDSEPPRRLPFRVVRHADQSAGPGVTGDGYGWQQLASGRVDHLLEAFRLRFPRGGERGPLVSHPGEEFCFVLSGTVAFQVGDEVVRLRPGDSIHLQSTTPHMAWSDGAGEAEILMITAMEHESAIAVEWWARHAAAIPREGPPGSADT